jgi:hypothetical protein
MSESELIEIISSFNMIVEVSFCVNYKKRFIITQTKLWIPYSFSL